MERTRQQIPEALADMPPGPELAAVLATIDPRRLSGGDCVELLRAQHRQTSHEQAQLMAAMVEVALCGIGPDDQLPRMAAPDEFSADEIRAALSWTRAAANTQLSLAWDLIDRLPEVFGALEGGSIDVPKARVFSEWTQGLTDGQAQAICERLLPEASCLTTGQLTERIKRMAIAIDPGWARRRYEEAVRDRKVIGYRTEDGTANLCGYSLPADRVAAACAHIDALAKRAKHTGDARPIDHIRADLYLLMLDGSCTGWSDHDIITHLLSTVATHDDHGTVAHHPCQTRASSPTPDKPDREGITPHRPTPCDTGQHVRHDQTPRSLGSKGHNTHDKTTKRAADKAPWPPRGLGAPGQRAGVEIRVEITTLLGLDEHPGEIAGWDLSTPTLPASWSTTRPPPSGATPSPTTVAGFAVKASPATVQPDIHDEPMHQHGAASSSYRSR